MYVYSYFDFVNVMYDRERSQWNEGDARMRTARFLDGSEHPLAQRKSGIGEHKASRVSNHTETHALKVGVREETVISTRAGSSSAEGNEMKSRTRSVLISVMTLLIMR